MKWCNTLLFFSRFWGQELLHMIERVSPIRRAGQDSEIVAPQISSTLDRIKALSTPHLASFV